MQTDEKTEDGTNLEELKRERIAESERQAIRDFTAAIDAKEEAEVKLLEYATANERLADENSKIEALAIALLHHIEIAHYHSSSIPAFGMTRAEVARMARRTFAISTRAEIIEPGRASGHRFGPFERDALIECQGHQVKVKKLTPKTIILMPWAKRKGAV